MSGRDGGPDPLAVAAGAAALGGLLALWDPSYFGLALAAAALGAVAWFLRSDPTAPRILGRPPRAGRVAGLLAIAGSWGLAIAAPAGWGIARAPALAAGALALWLLDRGRPDGRRTVP